MPLGIGGEVAWWCPSLDDSGNGTLTLNDLVGSTNGTLTNMETTDWVSDTDSGGVRALQLDGTNEFIRTALGLQSFPFSVSGWAKSTTVAANQYAWAFCRSGSNDGQFGVLFQGLTAGDPINVRQETDAGAVVAATSASGFVANQWYHVVAIYRSNDYRQIYVNGVAGTANTTSSSVPTVNRFSMGILDRPSPSGPFSGRLDDIRIFGKELNEVEIALLSSKRGYQPNVTRRRRYAGGYGL